MPQVPQICFRNQNGHSLYNWLKQHLLTKDYVNAHPIRHVTLPISFQTYRVVVHICPPCHSTMANKCNGSSGVSDAPATRKKRMEQVELLEPTNICTYRPMNPAFEPKRVLRLRLFFINQDRAKYVCWFPPCSRLSTFGRIWGRPDWRWSQDPHPQ